MWGKITNNFQCLSGGVKNVEKVIVLDKKLDFIKSPMLKWTI